MKYGKNNNHIDNLYLLTRGYRDTQNMSAVAEWRLVATGKMQLAGQTQRKKKQWSVEEGGLTEEELVWLSQ